MSAKLYPNRYSYPMKVIWAVWLICLAGWFVPATDLFGLWETTAWGIHIGGVTPKTNGEIVGDAKKGVTVSYALLLWLPVSLYILASIRRIQTYEVGGIMVLERPTKEVEPGLVLVPLWLAELHTYPVSPQRKQYPGTPEDIFKGKDEDPLPREGMVRAIRATTHAPKKPEAKKLITNEKGELVPSDLTHDSDLLNIQKTIEVTFFVIWKIRPQGFFDFYLNIPGEAWSEKLKNVEEQIRDSAETDLVEQISKHTLGELLSDLEGINRKMRMHIAENMGKFGIEIMEARMQNPDISYDLSQALQRIPIANANRVATVTAAKAEKEKLELEGQGRAAAIVATTEAKGKGQAAAAKLMGMDPAQYRAGEVAVEALGNNSTIVLGVEGLAHQILGGITRIAGKGADTWKESPQTVDGGSQESSSSPLSPSPQ